MSRSKLTNSFFQYSLQDCLLYFLLNVVPLPHCSYLTVPLPQSTVLSMVTLLNCEYRNCEYCFCDLTFANIAIVKYIPLKIANLAIVKYISINIANFLILYNLQLITQQMSSFMSFVISCVIYFAVYLWYLEHFVFIHCSDVRWIINEELVNNTIPNTIFFMPK